MLSWKARVLVDGPPCQGILADGRLGPGSKTRQIVWVPEIGMAEFQSVIRNAAVLCAEGGPTSHLAVACRILGIPVLLLEDVPSQLPIGELVTVDPAGGMVFWGEHSVQPLSVRDTNRKLMESMRQKGITFQITIIDEMNIRAVNKRAPSDVDCFFLRSEFVWAKADLNPFSFVKEAGLEEATRVIHSCLLSCKEELSPGQFLVFRSLDMASDEFAHLRGSEAAEANPQIGLHGIRHLLLEQDLLIAAHPVLPYFN